MKPLRGTSVYLGIGISPERIGEHLKEAHAAGINAVFTSLQLPESDPDVGIIGQILPEDLPPVDIFKVKHGAPYPEFRFLIEK